jgi:mono/diheme cytochrome c family protein
LPRNREERPVLAVLVVLDCPSVYHLVATKPSRYRGNQMQSRLQIRAAMLACSWVLVAVAVVHAAPQSLAKPIKQLIEDRCTDCHDAEQKKGDLDLTRLLADFDPERDLDRWVKVESAIIKGKMPPPKEDRLKPAGIKAFGGWFEKQFVTPGGVQHAGPNLPRRLTREELQNTLEDILHVQLRQQVTNSRLHVIPDTIIEKFFAAGVLGKSGSSNNAATLNKDPVDIQTLARCLSMVLSLVDSSDEAKQQLLGTTTPAKQIPLAQARQILSKFGRSAFRRPLTDTELQAYVGVYQKTSASAPAYEAIKRSFLAILLSPPFLYRFETPAPGQAAVVGDELAVRLSYFLWSAPPDETLLDLAASGKLRQPEVLKQQVRRMLADPRRIALAENLGGEWFDYKQLRQQSAVNKRSDKMAGFYRTQYEEALLFFDSIIRYDQPIFRIVDADWAFLNGHQARIYRLRMQKKTFASGDALPPISIHFRRTSQQVKSRNYEYKHAPLNLVKLSQPNRGGFITIGPTMSVTSTANRTSPIRRGAWVMERILGVHFVPPKDVPDLEATQKKAKSQRLNLSPNEILKLHSSQKGCAECHQYIDPIGFGLEMYSPLGIPRSVPAPRIKRPVGGMTFRWSPAETPRKFTRRTWTLTKPPKAGKPCHVYFQWTKGGHGLDVKNVRLTSGKLVLTDAHVGFTGGKNRQNVWRFSIPKGAPKTGWILSADVKGSHGTDSTGTITVAGTTSQGSGRKLPNGTTFSSPAELKQQLLAGYRDEIIDNVVRRVLAYALGRQTMPIDRPAIRRIKEVAKKNDHRMVAVIEAVVLSYPFRHKENSR